MLRSIVSHVVLLVLAVSCTGCGSPPKQLANWFTLQKAYAAELEKAAGGRGFHYEPVVATAWPAGTVFDSGSAAPRSTCPFDVADLRRAEFATLPKHTGTFDSGFTVNPPKSFLEAINAASAKAGLSAKDTLELHYYDLRTDYVENDVLLKRFSDEKCFASVADFVATPKEIIRGQVRGKMKVVSSKGFNANTGVSSTTYGEYELHFDANGGFEIVDDTEKTRFLVRSYLRADQHNVDSLSAMTPEELRKYLGDLGYGSIQSLGGSRQDPTDVVSRLTSLGKMYNGKLVLPSISDTP